MNRCYVDTYSVQTDVLRVMKQEGCGGSRKATHGITSQAFTKHVYNERAIQVSILCGSFLASHNLGGAHLGKSPLNTHNRAMTSKLHVTTKGVAG